MNRFQEALPSPLEGEGSILKVDPAVEAETVAGVQRWREERDNDAVKRSIEELRRVAESGENIMAATIDLAHAGGTTGEWAGTLREVFGEYRAPTGVAAAAGVAGGSDGLRALAERVKALPGGPPRLLVAKPGLDGHSNGAEQIAVAARDAGLEVIYQGIRLTPEQIASVALDEDVDVIGLSILSGSHLELVPEVVRLCRERGVDAPVVAGGIIPEEDRARLLAADVAAVYTPKDFELTKIMGDIVDLAIARAIRFWRWSRMGRRPQNGGQSGRAARKAAIAGLTTSGWVMFAAWVPPSTTRSSALGSPSASCCALSMRDGGVGGAVDDERGRGDLAEAVLDRVPRHQRDAGLAEALLGACLPLGDVGRARGRLTEDQPGDDLRRARRTARWPPSRRASPGTAGGPRGPPGRPGCR